MWLMAFLLRDVDDLVGIDIDDSRAIDGGLAIGDVLPVKVRMSVKQITRLDGADEPVQGFQPIMSQISIIMDTKWRGMGDENIQGAPITDEVSKQAGHHLKGTLARLHLCVLVGAIGAVAD